MHPVVAIVLLSLMGVAGDLFLKFAGNGPKSVDVKLFIAGFVVYACTAFGWFYVLKHMKLSSLSVIYSIANILILVFIGVFYFRERLNIYEIIGIVGAIGSMVLLSRFA